MKLDFEHKQAGHCETGALRNLLNYNGLKISEPMVFGIGAGLFFSYIPFVKVLDAPMTSFRVWPGQVFGRVTNHLGVQKQIHTFRNPKDSMDKLNEVLDSGIPVGLQVGLYNLPFFPPQYRMHYNMHNMVVYGHENGTYYVSDSAMEFKVEIKYEDLIKVRYAKGPFAPEGKMYYLTSVPKEVDLKPLITKGIRKTAYFMADVPFPLIGTRGIRYMAGHMRKWEKKVGQVTASYYLGQLLRMLESVGTAGAGFRYMYGAFLDEASSVLNKPLLKEVSIELGETSNLWREFSYLGARNCKKRGVPEESYDFLADKLVKIAEKEDVIFKKLLKFK